MMVLFSNMFLKTRLAKDNGNCSCIWCIIPNGRYL